MDDLRPESNRDLGSAITPRGGRALLPFEVDLCESVGLTADEYLHFCALTDSYNGQRPTEYDDARIPVVQNDLVSIGISIVVGVALQYLSSVLVPKPKEPGTALKTNDDVGTKKFAAIEAFEGVQELASLGSIIPLIFARRSDSVGGIRVRLMLLWSQLLSEGASQQIKAVFTPGFSYMGALPDFDGYAIGDLLLKNYTQAKVALYFKSGGRISEANRYGQGALSQDPAYELCRAFNDRINTYAPMFSGGRNPATQSRFGVYYPIANATGFKLNHELVMILKDAKGKADLRRKRDKLGNTYAPFCSFVWSSRYGATDGRHDVYPGDSIVFEVAGSQLNPDKYSPWGLADVNGLSEARRTEADDGISVGEIYMAGSAMVICRSVESATPWSIGVRRSYAFEVIEPGVLQVARSDSWLNPPYGDILLKVAVATVTNNRICDVTELGIRSRVWKLVQGFPNVNSQPDDETIQRYERDNTQITLGTVQRYVTRFSFFRLQIRHISDQRWWDFNNGRVFCIRGNSPQPQYNFIRISHPRGQWEFRLLPVPGGTWIHQYRWSTVYELMPGDLCRYVVGGFTITFAGRERLIGGRSASNSVWYKTEIKAAPNGEVRGLSSYTKGTIPSRREWQVVERRFDRDNYVTAQGTKFWNGRSVTKSQEYRRGQAPYNKENRYPIERWAEVTVEAAPVATQDVGVSGGLGGGLTLRVTAWANGAQRWAILSGGAGYAVGDAIVFAGPAGMTQVSVAATDDNDDLKDHMNPFDAVADLGLYEAESFSHDSEPEHEIVYVNEQLEQTVAPQYDDLTLVGLRLNASKEMTNFSQLTAYIKRGLVVHRLINDNGTPVAPYSLVGSTNNLAEIVYALLTDKRIGAGSLVGVESVDRERMQQAAIFCHANGFTWDGVIAERLNLRDWIFRMAGYCLLDFTVLGGRFALAPSCPVDSQYRIDNNQKPSIAALFTDGNMRDLKVSWLSPEQRQLFKAVVRYRDEIENGFSQVRTLAVSFTVEQGGSDADPEEEFDMSGFCTSRTHALTFAQSALCLRREVDHGLTFETTPGAGLSLSPGQYVRVVSEVTHTSRFNNGSINDEGLIISTTALTDGTYRVAYWEPGSTSGVQTGQLGVIAGRATNLYGTVFTLISTDTSDRVYKVEAIERGEEGFVRMSLSHQPLRADGSLATMDWDPSYFNVQEF